MKKIEKISKYRSIEKLKERCDIYFSKKLNLSPKKPEFIILDVTHKCNLKCIMCEIYQDKESFKKDLKTEEIKKVIKDAKDWGVREVIFSGGEALTRKDILNIIEYVKEINYRCGILTNGILPNKLFEKLIPYLKSNIISLTISLDGFYPETHDSIRGVKDTHKNTTELFSKLKKLKQQYPNINYTAITVIMNKNLEEIPKIVEFLKSVKVSEIQFQALIENNLIMKERKKKHEMWIPEKRLNLLDKTINWLIEFKGKNHSLIANTIEDLTLIKRYFRKELKKEDVICFQNYKTMLMSNDGRITTCFNALGNVKEKTLIEIWESAESKKGRYLVNNCNNPCLIPCFVDFRLASLENIFKEFFIEIETEIKNKKEKEEMIREAKRIIEEYETEIIKKSK